LYVVGVGWLGWLFVGWLGWLSIQLQGFFRILEQHSIFRNSLELTVADPKAFLGIMSGMLGGRKPGKPAHD
jgi:hypothetical protein